LKSYTLYLGYKNQSVKAVEGNNHLVLRSIKNKYTQWAECKVLSFKPGGT